MPCVLHGHRTGQQNPPRPNGHRHRQSMSNTALPGTPGPAGTILTPPGMIAPSRGSQHPIGALKCDQQPVGR
ncbi:hypothetical protein BN1263330077 [Stenotrophomonas maltophilia]|nr:hypothetical protein BN1263330077 [Stenotrophomonas maltophilia]